MGDVNIVSVENNNDNTINLEIIAYKNSADVNFVESTDSALAVHNSSETAHSYLQNKIELKANSSDMATLLARKVDIVSGKGLSSNDLTNTLKSNYDMAYSNSHIHINKTALDNVSGTNTGDETQSTILTKLGGTVLTGMGTCSTASATTEKAVTLLGFSLAKGANIIVTFTNANTAIAPTLNVNSTGVKAICSEDGTIASVTNPAYFPAGSIVEFTYNGTYWVFKNRITTNYVNGMSHLRVWTDGWIEQGGYVGNGGNGTIVTLLKAFLNTNYIVNGNSDLTTSTSFAEGAIDFYNKTTASFKIWYTSCEGRYFNWRACGY